jgi:hypothetical protein
MKALHLRIGIALVSVIVFALLAATAQEASPTTSDHWDLGLTTTDADISPDDRLIAVTSEFHTAPHATAQTVESLEVWDYRQHNKIASSKLATYVWAERGTNPVRFTADGLLLAAADSTKVHVFETASLRAMRLIEPPLPQGYRISALEPSPIGHVSIIVTRRERRTCMLFAYDLDTGDLLFDWKPPDWVCPISIAWKPDGTQIAVTATGPSIKADRLHIFSTNPWAHVRTLKGEIPGPIAFSNDHLYAVEGADSKSSLFKSHLDMTVFDAHGWKRQKAISLPHKDIHDSVSFANGRLLADTGTVKTDFDWLDGVRYAFATSAQITIWEGEARTIIFTSTPLPTKRPSGIRMRLSRTGRMVLFNPQNPQVFQIP